MDGKNRLQPPGSAPRSSGLRSPPMDALLEQMASTEENARSLVDRLRRKLAELRQAQDLATLPSRDARTRDAHGTGDRAAKLQSSGSVKSSRLSNVPSSQRSQINAAAFFKVTSAQAKYALQNPQIVARCATQNPKTSSIKEHTIQPGDRESRTTAEGLQVAETHKSRSFLEGDRDARSEKHNKERTERPASWGPPCANASKSRDISSSREHSRSHSPLNVSFCNVEGSKTRGSKNTSSKSSRVSLRAKDSRDEKVGPSGKSSQTTLSRKHSDNSRKSKSLSRQDSPVDLSPQKLPSKIALGKRTSSKSFSVKHSRETSSSRTSSRRSSQNIIVSRHSSPTKIVASGKSSQTKQDLCYSQVKLDEGDRKSSETKLENRKPSYIKFESRKPSQTKIECQQQSRTKVANRQQSRTKVESRQQSRTRVDILPQSRTKIASRKHSQSKVSSRKPSQTRVPSRNHSQSKVEMRKKSQTHVSSRFVSPPRSGSRKPSPMRTGGRKSSPPKSGSRKPSQTKFASHKSSQTKSASRRSSSSNNGSRMLSPQSVTGRKSSPAKITSRNSSATKFRSGKSSSNLGGSATPPRRSSHSTMPTMDGSRSNTASVGFAAAQFGCPSYANSQYKCQANNKPPSRKSSGTTVPLVKLSKDQLQKIFSSVRVEKWKDVEEKTKIFNTPVAGTPKKPDAAGTAPLERKEEGSDRSLSKDNNHGSHSRRPGGVRSMGVAVERLLREAERGAELTSNALRSLKAAERQLHEAATSPWLPVLALGRARSPEAVARAAGHEERVAQATRWVAHALDDVMRCFDAYGELERQLAKPDKPGGYHWHEWSEAEVASALKAIAAAEGALAVDAAAALAAHAVTLDLLASDTAALEVFEQRQRHQLKMRHLATTADARHEKRPSPQQEPQQQPKPPVVTADASASDTSTPPAVVTADGDAKASPEILTMTVNVPVSRAQVTPREEKTPAAEPQDKKSASVTNVSEEKNVGEAPSSAITVSEGKSAPETSEPDGKEDSSSTKTFSVYKEECSEDKNDVSNQESVESSDGVSLVSEEGQSLSSKASTNTATTDRELGNASSLKTIREVVSVETAPVATDLIKRGSSYTTCPSPSIKMSTEIKLAAAGVPVGDDTDGSGVGGANAVIGREDSEEVETWTLQTFDETEPKAKEEPEKEEIRTSHSLHEAAHILSNVASKKAVVVSNSWGASSSAQNLNENLNELTLLSTEEIEANMSAPLSVINLLGSEAMPVAEERSNGKELVNATVLMEGVSSVKSVSEKERIETVAAGILEDIMSKVLDIASQFEDAEELDRDVDGAGPTTEGADKGVGASSENVRFSSAKSAGMQESLSEALVVEEGSEADESDSVTTRCRESSGDRKTVKERQSRSRSRSNSPKKNNDEVEEARVGGRKGAKGDGGTRRSCAELEEWKMERAAEMWTENLEVEGHSSTTTNLHSKTNSRAVSREVSRCSSSTSSNRATGRYAAVSAVSGVNAPDDPPALVAFAEHLLRDGFQVEYTRVASDSSGRPPPPSKTRVRAAACGMSAEATASSDVVAQRRATLLLAAELARRQAEGRLPVGVSFFKDDELLALATLARVEAGSAGAETWLLAECQRRRRSPPRFRVVAAPGPTSVAAPSQQLPVSGGDDAPPQRKQPHFIVECTALDLCAAGMGPKKYSARRAAAEELLEMLDKMETEKTKESPYYTVP